MALRGPHTVDTRRGEPSAEEEQEVQHIGGAASIHHPSSLNLSTLPPHSTPKFSANLINMSPCHMPDALQGHVQGHVQLSFC